MKKKAILVLLLCVALLLAIDAFSKIGVAQETTKTLRIGGIMTLSGRGAATGIPFHNTIVMQSDECNKAGGITVGKQKYKLELIVEDDKYSAEGARIAAEKLIYQDKVKIVLGPVISPSCLAVNPIFEEHNIFHLVGSGSPKVLDPKYTYNFRPYITAHERAPALYRWIRDNLRDIKRIAVIDMDDEAGYSTSSATVKNAKANGFEVFSPIFYPRGTSEFFPLMTKVLATKPDYIDCGSGSMGEVAMQVKAARQLGFKGYMSIAFPQDYNELCKIAGKEFAEGFILGDTLAPDALPSAKPFIEAYQARWNYWDAYALKWSIYLPILIESLKAAGTVEDTAKIRNTAEKMGYDTILGHLRWSGAKTYGISHQIYTPYGLSKVHNCQLVNLGVVPAKNVMEAMGEK